MDGRTLRSTPAARDRVGWIPTSSGQLIVCIHDSKTPGHNDIQVDLYQYSAWACGKFRELLKYV